MHSILKFIIDFGPLFIFFAVDQIVGIFWATGALMIAAGIAFAISYKLAKTIPILPSVTLVFVLIFGGLTVFLGDESFIKIEVSLANALCGAFLLAGLVYDKSLLKIAFGEIALIDDIGWKKLTFRMGVFLLTIAALNEFARRILPTDEWVFFRVYGILGLSALFFLSQIPLIKSNLLNE
jgi:intracellular septation protein